jgi:hypothetical protein
MEIVLFLVDNLSGVQHPIRTQDGYTFKLRKAHERLQNPTWKRYCFLHKQDSVYRQRLSNYKNHSNMFST